MRFKINLATKIYVHTKLLNFSTVAAILVLSAFLILATRYVTDNAAKTKRLTREIATLDSKFKASSKGVSEKDYHALLEKIAFANNVIEKKAYNWLELLDKLEQVVPEGVAISSIDPDPKSHELKLSGEARNFSNLRLFMEHLEDSPFFTDVYLTGEGETKQGEAKQGISFSLSCKVTK
jgi:type IV pilus assembly protein PilN